MENRFFSLRSLFQAAFFAVFFGAILWSFGFANFIRAVGGQENRDVSAGGIVVLTGGQGRIAAGLDALKAGRGQRLLISGVNQSLDDDTILAAISEDQALLDCCIDLGPVATDTVSNAEETAAWARRNGFSSIIVVTSDYHMPRALVAFSPYLEDFEVEPLTVATRASPLLLMWEYNKYLLSLARPGAEI